ncbi:hypothetical protein [Burkholderia pseudomallei]|uniref:hypothetical protein n=1 Tax=Burkholderia pseudomallei TaxID=28450 RepID=UPI00100B9C09|nr:hypothetical protein [Burkholderia pseudomallei]
MSDIKHSRGPWNWDDTVWNYDPEQQAPWLLDGDGNRVLSGEIQCNEANARLIAAAPELLEALLDAKDWLTPSNSPHGLRERINIALAKARGEA